MTGEAAGDRPQDELRPHRRARSAPAPEVAAVLERYRGAMIAELGDTLDELRPDREQLTLTGGSERMRPALAERLKLWDLAVKLGRELAGAEVAPPAPGGTALSQRPPASAPRLTAAQRRQLGGE